MKNLLLTALCVVGISCCAAQQYNEENLGGFIIKNIDDGYTGQGYCSLLFSVESIANPFDNPLEVELAYLNEKGNIVEKSLLYIPAFGQARANQKILTSTDYQCTSFDKLEIKHIWEVRGDKRIELPLNIAVPEVYKPAVILNKGDNKSKLPVLNLF